ncbi:MAG: HEAT repeat domain-containing protein [Steroidobacteraceae bacterium]
MNTGSDFIVALAWRSAEVAAIGAALLMTMALAVHRYMLYEERLRERVIASWRPLLTRAALEAGEPPAMPRLTSGQTPYLMEEWNSLQDAMRGDATERLNAVALKLGLDAVARELMRSRQIGKRILAIRTLGHLRDPMAWKSLQGELVSANALLSFYAAAALVQIDAQRAMPGIMLQLAERESWPGEAMARLLVDAGADVAREPIRALMLSLEPAKVAPLVQWLAHVDAVLGSEVATELLHRHSDNDVIVAATLMVLLEPAVVPELRRFATSNDAEIRKNLAQAIGRLGDLGETDLLMTLMGDRVWWVRYRAAQALLKLRGMNAAELESVRTRLTDPYALDMLKHVRAEEGPG